jgi:uncharacterized repeat protein (TIGR04138 family)
MIQDKFSLAVDEIVARDPRFERDAYFFVRDALEYTVKRSKRSAPKTRPGSVPAAAEGGGEERRHVSGQELLEGVRQYALEQFGPMVPTVFEHWRLSRCEDIGAIVFNLIGEGIFGKTERDSVEDFGGGYDFHEAFVLPFLSAKATAAARPGEGRGSAAFKKSA